MRGRGVLAQVCATAVAVSALSGGCALTPHRDPAAPLSVDSSVPYQLIQEPDAGYRPLADLIGSARHSVRMVIYELHDDNIVAALADAQHRGVHVNVLLDSGFHGQAVNADAYARLQHAGVDVTWAPAAQIMHQKTIVADDTTAAVGTGNLTAKWYPTSRDAWVLDTNTADVAAIAATFDADFTAEPVGHPTAATPAAHLIWSPAARAAFIQHIDDAARSLDVTTEELKDRAVIGAIEQAARRGVACRIVMTQNLSWDKAVAEVSAAGCSVHLLPNNPSALYMHEKVLLTDGHSLIIGSHNLSTASLLHNRELSLQLDDTTCPAVIAAVRDTFERDYQQALPAPTSLH